MELKNFFAQDEQGNLLGGATCYLYARGTENLAAGLQAANGTALANPFTADATGLIQFAAANGLYDLRVVKNARDYRVRGAVYGCGGQRGRGGGGGWAGGGGAGCGAVVGWGICGYGSGVGCNYQREVLQCAECRQCRTPDLVLQQQRHSGGEEAIPVVRCGEEASVDGQEEWLA